ncbi:MAG: asparagine synthase (glutamine-hydrolyzing) [Rhodospirillaceae bacterium]|nr:asparagine synthase (glutamine-hydrolyzing) [Rhodospirillaceae bacterium]
MCGIAGFVGSWAPALAGAITTALAHRGPDGSGLWSEDGVALGHRRLSIIDLSDAAAQPMHSADDRYVITYNGEIYNFRDLQLELQQSGIKFRTGSDTEVLLSLFARDGLDCVDRLNGIFAFAIWDRHHRVLSIARDHMGVKPLYYATLPQGFLFASDLKSLTLCPDVPRDIDATAVGDHLGFIWTAGENTMIRAVKKLRPGSTLTVSAGGSVTRSSYYSTPKFDASAAPTPNDAAALRDMIDQVVADQMVADVEVGALLSGGVDSSAIVAAMCRATDPSKITTFCAAVTKPDSGTDNFGDDQNHARAVAQHLGVKLIEVATDADLIAALPDMVWQLDEPTADFAGIQTLLLARAARENGIKVLLSGVGGDDLFTGYGRHTAGLIWSKANRIPGLRGFSAMVLGMFSPASIVGRRLKRIGALLSMPEDAMLANAMSYSEVSTDRRRLLLAPALRDAMPPDGIAEGLRMSLDRTRGHHPVERLLDLELNGFMPDHNLNYTDKMAMEAGVEVRVPLIDQRLVAYAMQLPLSAKISLRDTKLILRASQHDRLPAEILTRPKQGFGVPVRSWLQGPARDMMEELTSPAAVSSRGLFDADAVADLKDDFYAQRVDAAFTLFPMMAMELWCRALDNAETASP